MIKGKDCIGVSLVYFCHDGNGNFLMQKRGKNARDEHGRWDIGAGALEIGENVEGRLRTEILQEYTTDILSYEFLGYRDVHRQDAGKPTHWIGLDFKVLVDKRIVTNGEPHKFDEIGWFTPENIPSPTHSQFPDFLKRYRERLFIRLCTNLRFNPVHY